MSGGPGRPGAAAARRPAHRRFPLPHGPVSALVVAPLVVGTIVALDLVHAGRDLSVAVWGLMDEPAHLLTAYLALLVVPAWRRFWPWVLLGSVAIDADHVPLYFWGLLTPDGGGRPITHSLLTPVVLLGIALAVPRARTAATGLAIGVLLHFARDIATDTGLPLLWPAPQQFLLPYWSYVAAMSAAAVVAVVTGSVRPGSAGSDGGVRGSARSTCAPDRNFPDRAEP